MIYGTNTEKEGSLCQNPHDVVHMLPSTDPSNLVCRILGYNQRDLSKVPAIKYGLDNEAFVRDWYMDEMELLHNNFNCRESCFYTSKTEPYLGASPECIQSNSVLVMLFLKSLPKRLIHSKTSLEQVVTTYGVFVVRKPLER
eukprot:gene2038-2317_t